MKCGVSSSTLVSEQTIPTNTNTSHLFQPTKPDKIWPNPGEFRLLRKFPKTSYTQLTLDESFINIDKTSSKKCGTLMVVKSNNENNETIRGSPGPAGSFFPQVQIIRKIFAEAELLCKAATDITHHVGETNQGEDHHADGVTTCETCGGWSPAKQILHESRGGGFLGEWFFPPNLWYPHNLRKQNQNLHTCRPIIFTLQIHISFLYQLVHSLSRSSISTESQLNPNTIPPIACG